MIHRFYNQLKIQGKYTLVILLAVLIPFAILASAFSGRLYDMIISDTIRSAQTASEETSPVLEDVIDKVITFSTDLTSTDYFEKIFYNSTGRSLSEVPFTASASEFKNKVKDLEDQGITVKIYMGIPEDSTFFNASTSKDVFYPISEAKGRYWYGIFQGRSQSALFCPTAYLGKYEIENYGDCAYITYITAYDKGVIYPCYMALYYSSDIFVEALENNMVFSNGVSYIINDHEEIIASTNNALSATYRLGYADIEDSLMSSNSFIERDVLGAKVYVAFYYLSTPKWFLVTVIPEAPLVEAGNQLIFRFIFICLACVLFAICFAIFQSKSITDRIAQVIHQMGRVKYGPPIPMPESDSNDEVGELINTYNYMANQMQKLIEQEQHTAENLRIAEFNALQSQINPHFLYNTMDMINWMAKEGRNEEVSAVVQRLSKFYKLTLSRKNTINAIADELEHVTLYVELMNMRHCDAIDLVIDISDELTNFTIPKLTLQPIVENSILHGILEKDSKEGTIIITGWESDDDIVILISDDGVGMSKDKMDAILTDKPIGPTKGSNVAISNIHHRLMLLYGKEYGLSYSSTIGTSTEVQIKIPKLIG